MLSNKQVKNPNIYPYNVFRGKYIEPFVFSPITVFYGNNGSGKSTLLNIIANKLQLTIILLSGLRRETKRRIEHKPILYDLERSGCPVADLDIAIFLCRDDYYKKKSKCPDTTELIVAKNNFGDTVTIFLKRSSNSIFHS